ncbi:hypothetical protein ACFQS2_12295 [Brachybacterium sp. GCM10030267]|uniref:hypothetical protein n=1 Tax=unclassified Brachybacterium TaxID=2623841 RepID=UPI0036195712
MSAAVPQATQEERLHRARAALGAAERSAARWGGPIDRTALRSLEGGRSAAPAPPGAAPAGTSTSASPASAPAPIAPGQVSGTLLPVPAPLAGLFPHAGLSAGGSVAVEGAATTSLLLALAVAAAGEDSWCAVAGMPDLGLRSALDAGLDPERLALAPASGEQRPQVLTALADGVGVLVLGPDLELTPALWRSLLSRVRSADTLVLAARPPGRADITLTSTTRVWHGLGQGSGRLRRRRLAVASTGRGIAGHQEVEVLLPHAGGMVEAVSATADAPSTAPAAPRGPAGAASSTERADIAPVASHLTLHDARRAG